MDSPEEQKGADAPQGSSTSVPEEKTSVSYAPTTDNSSYYDDSYPNEDGSSSPQDVATAEPAPALPAVTRAAGGSGSPPPPPPRDTGDEDDEEGMLRMSFLQHLEELRSRLIRMIAGVGVAFIVSLTFSNRLWLFVSAPAVDALRQLGFKNTTLTQITPMEVFNTVWVKLPILCAIFLSSPWILYQVWAFIAPGLYKRERRWAAPFVIGSAGLFILGGVFAYFVAFRFGLTFLLGIGRDVNITPMVSVTEYFDLFVNVILGVGLVFELPVLIFFLTLLRIVTPKFLIANSRYAILGIVIIAAIVTPTPDVVNLMLFATPMCILFYVGILASYLLILHRENRTFPWKKVLSVVSVILLLIAGVLYLAVTRYGYHVVRHWPFLLR